jgi:transcriptional regulator with XRE-family HTH domain
MSKNPSLSRYLEALSDTETDKSIAERLAVSPSTVGRWRKGESDITPRALVNLARAYGQHPLGALLAAGYLTDGEIDMVADRVEAPKRWTLDDFTTRELLEEALRRTPTAEEDEANGLG